MMDWGGGMWSGGMWSGGGWVTFVLSIAFLVTMIAGVVIVVRALSGGETGGGTGDDHRPPARHRETPEELVRRRYAAGEIDREEYQQKLRDLSG